MEQARGIIVKTLTILAGFWIADLAAARVQAGLAAGESIERIMDGMTTMLQHPLALGFDRTSLLCGLGGACAVGLFHLYRWSMKRNWRDGEEYGSARWSTSREMAPYTDNDTRQNLQMTATEGLSLDARQTLNAVADMRDLLEASEQDETKESQVDAVAKTATEIYDETRAEWEREDADHDDPDLQEAWRLAQGLKFAARQYRPFTQGAGETKKGIIISLGVRLAPLTVGPVREILSDDNLGIDRIGGYQDEHEGGWKHPNGKTAIFLALPDEDPTFNFLAAIFYQCLFDSIIRRCRTYPGECLATPLHCFLDEFANVGRIPNFDKLIATIRSRKVSVSIILQTIAQLKTMYKDSWETIVGNCDSVLFLGGNEQSTTEWLSKLLGKETIDIRTTSDSKGVSGSHTTNYQRTGRELLTPDELAQLDNDKCIYNLRGLHPFLSRKAWPGTTIARPKSTLKHSKEWKAAA